MIYLKIGRRRLWIELWSRLFAICDWDFHAETRASAFKTQAIWFGPFHILISDIRPTAAAIPTATKGAYHG